MKREIVLVAAVARNWVIGRDGSMPWHCPADLKRFKSMTMGKPCIMGRRTFDSIGKPLPGRTNIVMSRSMVTGTTLADDGEMFQVVRNPETALFMCGYAPEVMVIGGGEVYRQFMPLATRIELTVLPFDADGDTTFPGLEFADGVRYSSQSEQGPDGLTYLTIEVKGQAA